jgi:hypothetical protein
MLQNLIGLGINVIRRTGGFTPPPAFQDVQDERTEFLLNKARLVYDESTIQEVLTYRQSDTSDDALIEDFMRIEQPVHIIPKDYHFHRAINRTRELFRPNRILHPVSFPDLRYYKWNLPPSAEAPWSLNGFVFTPTFRSVDSESETPKLRQTWSDLLTTITRSFKWLIFGTVKVSNYLNAKMSLGMITDNRRSFHNLYDEIFIFNRNLIHRIKDGLAPFWKDGIPQPYYWNTLHARAYAVSVSEPDKIRSVFGATKLLLMAENMFIWPLQATYLNTDAGRLLWGREIMKGGWRKLFSEMFKHGAHSTYLTVDWSAFDNRLLDALLPIIHAIWRV